MHNRLNLIIFLFLLSVTNIYSQVKTKTHTTIRTNEKPIIDGLLDEDIYDILILYELLDHTILSDTRYEMRDVSFTDIHPRVSKRIESIKKKCSLLNELGANIINVAECSKSIHSEINIALDSKPVCDDQEYDILSNSLNKAGEVCEAHGVELAFHHHMGTYIQNEDEIEILLSKTDMGLPGKPSTIILA